MKNIFITVLTILAVFSTASIIRAGDGREREATLKTSGTMSVTGKVSAVEPANTLTRSKARISIIDENNNPLQFLVEAAAVVYDSTGRIISLKDIPAGTKVQVNYKEKANKVMEASAIKIGGGDSPAKKTRAPEAIPQKPEEIKPPEDNIK